MRGYRASTLNNAKRLRRDLTDAERKLWSILRRRQVGGAKFRRQQPVGPYVADFLCAEVKLIIEVDGGQHSAEADAGRTAALSARGYRILRIWNNDVLSNLDGTAEVIRAALETPHPNPLPQGEREQRQRGDE